MTFHIFASNQAKSTEAYKVYKAFAIILEHTENTVAMLPPATWSSPFCFLRLKHSSPVLATDLFDSCPSFNSQLNQH